MSTQPISVITELHHIVITSSSYCHHIIFDVLMLYIISAITELHHIAILPYCNILDIL